MTGMPLPMKYSTMRGLKPGVTAKLCSGFYGCFCLGKGQYRPGTDQQFQAVLS
jgi:hypothetical protein